MCRPPPIRSAAHLSCPPELSPAALFHPVRHPGLGHDFFNLARCPLDPIDIVFQDFVPVSISLSLARCVQHFAHHSALCCLKFCCSLCRHCPRNTSIQNTRLDYRCEYLHSLLQAVMRIRQLVPVHCELGPSLRHAIFQFHVMCHVIA